QSAATYADSGPDSSQGISLGLVAFHEWIKQKEREAAAEAAHPSRTGAAVSRSARARRLRLADGDLGVSAAVSTSGNERAADHAALRLASMSLRLIRHSAIWMALSAAPLRRLSDTHHSARPFSTVGSSRIRLT